MLKTFLLFFQSIIRAKRYSPFLIASFCFILAEVIIQPIGEFPLNDDWAYSKAIKYFLDTGELKISNMIAIPFITQFLVGVSVCKVFGFSFFVLRMISIVLTIGLFYFIDKILLKFSFSNFHRILILLIITFNPLVFSIGNTFLPDTIIVFLAVVSVYFMIEFLLFNKPKYLIYFIVFTLLGTLNRQTGILIPAIFGLIYIFSRKVNYKVFFYSIIPFLISIISLILYEKLARNYHLLPTNYNLQLDNILEGKQLKSFKSILVIFSYIFTSISTLGLFIFPLIVSNLKSHIKTLFSFKIYLSLFVVFIIFLGYKLTETIWYMPFVGNIFYPNGIGPIIMTGFNSDKLILTDYNLSYNIKLIYKGLSILGGVSFFLSFISVLEKIRNHRNQLKSLVASFCLILIIIYVGLISLNYANDRYLLFLFPFYVFAYVISFDFTWNIWKFSISFLLMFYFTMAATFDYFSINKARWKGLDHLTKELKISPENIDGGFEFNAFYLDGRNDYRENNDQRWWWIVNDDYIVTPNRKIKNYSIESEYPFKSLISFSFDKIYVQKRDSIQ